MAFHEHESTSQNLNVQSPIHGPDVIRQLHTGHQLLVAEMISHEEFTAKKLEVITTLTMRGVQGSTDDLLLALAPLKQAGIVTPDEVQQIKRALIRYGG